MLLDTTVVEIRRVAKTWFTKWGFGSILQVCPRKSSKTKSSVPSWTDMSNSSCPQIFHTKITYKSYIFWFGNKFACNICMWYCKVCPSHTITTSTASTYTWELPEIFHMWIACSFYILARPLCRSILCILEDFAGNFPVGFFWAPSTQSAENQAAQK